jgi:hypothetical protein
MFCLRLRAALTLLEQRLEHKLHSLKQATRADIARLEQKLDNTIQRIEATVWKEAFAVLGGGLAIGGFLIRFVR